MTVSYQFVELGEGYQGDFDPDNPHDRELFRLDAIVNGEEVESLCTALPVNIKPEQRDKALLLVNEFARSNPGASPRTITEIFSYMDETWLEANAVPAPVMKLFGLWREPALPGTVEHLAAVILRQTHERVRHDYPKSTEVTTVNVVPGRDYTKVDVGPEYNRSGKYMVQHSTGTIFGIKGYGQVHKGHQYGTLDTVDQFWWGGYTAVPMERAPKWAVQ